MQRVVAELYAESLEGIVVNGMPVDGASGNFDLE